MRPSLTILALGAAVIAGAPSVATAQGFGIFEHGSCGMGRAGAGSAAPCPDGSAIFFNPAGIAGMQGVTLTSGATLIVASGSFTPDDPAVGRTDLNNDPIPVPHGFGVIGITDKVTAGLGIFAPYGLATEWPITGFEGRFVGHDNKLQSIYIQPTLAYKIHERVSIGAGLDIVVGLIEINQRLDFSQQLAAPGITFEQLGIPPQTDFADVRLRAVRATGVAGNFGVHVRLTDRFSVAARYLTRVTLNYDGEARFEPVPTGIILPAGNAFGVPAGTPLDVVIDGLGLFSPGAPLATGDVSTSITMPDQFLAGVAFQVTPQLLLLADYQWVKWSEFDQIELDFANPLTPDQTLLENYDNTSGIRLGLDWTASERWTLRGGYLYHQAAAPDETVTPLLPEANRNEVTAGLGVRISNKFTVDVAYQFIAQTDRRGRVVERLATETAADVNSGLYEFWANLIGLTVTGHF